MKQNIQGAPADILTFQDTLISCFPSQQSSASSDTTAEHDSINDLLTSIDCKFSECEDIIDLTASIIMHSAGIAFVQDSAKFQDLTGLYRWAITTKVCVIGLKFASAP